MLRQGNQTGAKSLHSWQSSAVSDAVLMHSCLRLLRYRTGWCIFISADAKFQMMPFLLTLSRNAHRWTANFYTMESNALCGESGCNAFGTSCSFGFFSSTGISKELHNLGCKWEFSDVKGLKGPIIAKHTFFLFYFWVHIFAGPYGN